MLWITFQGHIYIILDGFDSTRAMLLASRAIYSCIPPPKKEPSDIIIIKYEPTITVIKVKTMNTLWYDPGSSQCLCISLGTVDTTKSRLKFGSLPYMNKMFRCILNLKPPCWVGLVVSVSTSHTVGCEFASQPGHTKDHHKNVNLYNSQLNKIILITI